MILKYKKIREYFFFVYFQKFILTSPTIITSEFVMSNDERIGVNSERNCL